MKIKAWFSSYRSLIFHTFCCAGLISLAMVSQIDHVQAKVHESIPQETVYTVQTGDTLWQISKTYGLEVEELKAANQLTTNIIQIGQKLIIPQDTPTDSEPADDSASNEDSYIVQSGDSLWKIAKLLKINIKELEELNKLQSDLLQIGQILLLPKKEAIKVEKEPSKDKVMEEMTEPFPIQKEYMHPQGPKTSAASYQYSIPNWWGGINKETLKIPAVFTARLSGFLFEVNSRLTMDDVRSNKSTAIKVSSFIPAGVEQQINRIEEQGREKRNMNSLSAHGLRQTAGFESFQDFELKEQMKEFAELTADQRRNQSQDNELMAEEDAAEQNRGQKDISQEDIEWLAKIIEAEAEGEPYLGKVAVGSVVMNRVEDDWFPDTIEEVIFQKVNKTYQFSPVANGRIDRITPSEDAYKAAEEALNGEDPTNGALYFYNASISSDKWIRTRTISTEIGQHKFAF